MTGLAVLLLCLLVFVPGAGAVLALYGPGRLPLAARLAVAVGLGYAVVGFAGYLLTILHVLKAPVFFVVVSFVSAAVWFAAVRRFSLREQRRALAAELRADRWTLGVGLAVILAYALLRLGYLSHFPFISPFRYWVDGLEIADAGRIPTATLQYGRLYPPAISKVFLNSFSAGFSFVVSRHSIPALAAMLWLTSVGLAIALWAGARELGLRYLAPLVPVLVIANRVVFGKEMTIDLSSYRAEDLGRVIALAALVVGIRAIRDRDGWLDATVAGGLLAAGVGTHIIPVIVVAIMLSWYALARVVIDRDLSAVVKQYAVVGVIGGAVGLSLLLLPRGDIGFQGATSPGTYQHFSRGFDETEYLYTGKIVPPKKVTGRFYSPPGAVFDRYVSTVLHVGVTFGSRVRRDVGYLMAVGGFGVAIAMLLWFPKGLRPVGLVAWGLAATLFLITLAFDFHYRVYVTATFGIHRLFDYTAIPMVLMVLALAEGALSLLGRIRPWAPLAAGMAVVVLVAALVMPSVQTHHSRSTAQAQLVQMLDWFREHSPCDSRILVSQRTVGILRALTGRVGILEGMGPFLRPDILQDVVDMGLAARTFFEAPEANTSFLQDQGADYVVAAKTVRIGYGGLIGAYDPARLRSVPFLRLVMSNPGFDIYRVTGLPVETGFPNPVGRPGYRCERGPLTDGSP